MKEMNIREIEALTEQEMKTAVANGEAEHMVIKGHDCYFVHIPGYFGYSVLVFKNGRHIECANDYELHHKGKTEQELKSWYLEGLNRKLFTESELAEEVKSYDDYDLKSYYIQNYWPMQYHNVSCFHIFHNEQEKAEYKSAIANMFLSRAGFCYFDDEEIVKKHMTIKRHLDESYSRIVENENVFREMIRYELANHEAGITYSWEDALDSLGLSFKNLTANQQRIVKEELNRQIELCA